MINEYNEISYSKYLLKNGFLTKKITYELFLLAKYYFYLGNSKVKTRENIFEFCRNYIPKFNETLYWEKINKIIKNAEKSKIIELDKIPISKNDIQLINSFNLTKKEETVFFCLIVIYKIRELMGKKKYLNIKYSKFSKMCGLNSTKEIYPIMRKLENLNIIRICRNGDAEFLFELKNESPVFFISDINSSHLYFKQYKYGLNIKECAVCGKVFVSHGNRAKYCSSCSKKVKMKQNSFYYKMKNKENRTN